MLIPGLAMALAAFPSYAQKVSFAYDLDFDMQFDNREFYRSAYTSSMTIFGARLTPAVGVAIEQNSTTTHKLLAGIDVQKDFGASPVSPEVAQGSDEETSSKLSNLNLFREISLYYNLSKQIGRTGLSLYAGIFPRRYMSDDYSRAFFSDSLKFYDNNIEGLLIKIRRPKADFEVGCDWMGQYGRFRRERFMIFSTGKGRVAPVLSLGYSAWLYHYSISSQAGGVVDNVLLNPYVILDFGSQTGLQCLSLKMGWIQAMQNDRENVGSYVFPGGGELIFQIQHWNVGLRNELFVGKDLFPYYNDYDSAGVKYGNLLYPGSPFYRIWDGTSERSGKTGLADRLEVYYAPKIGSPYLDIKVSAIFHFDAASYCGCRQMVSFNFNLQELLKRKRK